MAEEQMVEIVESALRELGVPEEVTAAGQFMPRGHTGSMFAGGLVGDSLTGSLGGLADSVGTVGGSLAGAHVHDASTGLPGTMLVGVTPTHVCAFDSRSRHKRPGRSSSGCPGSGSGWRFTSGSTCGSWSSWTRSTGSRIELEGNRIPLTHSKDVIEALEH